MNLWDIMGPLTNIADWIELNIINGLVGGGFQFLSNAFNVYVVLKPVIDFFGAIFGIFSGLGA